MMGGKVWRTFLAKPEISLRELEESLKAAVRFRQEAKFNFFKPYIKQQQFFDMGLTLRERLLMAGNQLGKSEAGAFEMAVHLTGQYPDDWLGHRFDHPIVAWAAGESSLAVRDIGQTKLCGQPGVENSLGTGMIPKSAFKGNPALARGVTNAYDTIFVEHKTNGVVDGISTLSFKSYEQGQGKFQGPPIDLIWLDEEPPEDIYFECLARISATKGRLYVTFTPLKGMSTVVKRYLEDVSADRGNVVMTIDEALHYTQEEREKIIAGYPAWQRKTRTLGIPMMGEGRVFPYDDEVIQEPPLAYVPLHWTKLWGLDFGIGHPFAAVLIAWDRDNDIIHVLHAIRMVGVDGSITPINHAAAMKPVAGGVPVAWPQDGNQRDKGSGEVLAAIYKKHGLKMLPSHATWPEGGISTEAGITEIEERIRTGRFKVAAHLSEWFEEFRFYHRKDGQIVKVKDDLLSATRIAIMDKRHAKSVPLGAWKKPATGPNEGMAAHTELSAADLF